MKILQIVIFFIQVVFSLLLFFVVQGCGLGGGPAKSNKVVFHILSDPEHLGPLKTATGVRMDIRALIHQSVYGNNAQGEIFPILAAHELAVSEDGMTYAVSIHPDAKWEDGSPVTAKDVLFSLKYVLCPLTESQAPIFMEYIQDFKENPDNPRKFSVSMKQYYISNDYYFTNFPILNSKIYDPENVLANYSITDFLGKDAAAFENDTKIKSFADLTKDIKYGRNPAFVKGLGPYELVAFEAGKAITLKKKENYWAKGKQGAQYEQFPDTIVFKVLKEEAAYEQAFINGALDVSADLSSAVFRRLMENPAVKQNYNFYTGNRNVIASMFFNMKPDGIKHKKITDSKAVRQAIAYLCPIEEMINLYLEGFATRIASPVPLSSKQYNHKLSPLPFSPTIADSLLKSDGWKDSDGDGILDKVINGKKEKLSFSLIFLKNNRTLASMTERIVTEMKKSGILCIPEPVEQAVLQDKLFQHDFEAAFVSTSPPAAVYDFKQQWHTENWGQKGNFCGFGTTQTDKLIDQIRTTKDPVMFRTLSDSMQKIIYEAQPVVFFYNAKGKLIAHNRFEQADSVGYGRHELNRLKLK